MNYELRFVMFGSYDANAWGINPIDLDQFSFASLILATEIDVGIA